ncbi:MAG TPA: hypothetical protein VFH94_10840 [Streptomyces sp.]|nr:hypothetical protein [Streptomyces sp.]
MPKNVRPAQWPVPVRAFTEWAPTGSEEIQQLGVPAGNVPGRWTSGAYW